MLILTFYMNFFIVKVFCYLVIPITRRLILGKFINKKNYKREKNKNYIDGEFEDLGDDDDKSKRKKSKKA